MLNKDNDSPLLADNLSSFSLVSKKTKTTEKCSSVSFLVVVQLL